VAALGQFVGGLLAGQGFLGQLQVLVVGGQGQPGGGHFGHQADLRAAPGFGQCQVVFQRFVLQVLHAAEHVDFIAAQPQLGTVVVAGDGRAAAGQRTRRAAVSTADAGVDGRERRGPLDAVLRLGLLDIQAGQAQVAVIGHRQGLQLCQAAVGKELLPLDVGRHLTLHARLPFARHRGFRLLILRRQVDAAAQDQGGH